jgi:hypothetical protein
VAKTEDFAAETPDWPVPASRGDSTRAPNNVGLDGDEAVSDGDKAVAVGGELAEAAPQGALGTTVDQGYLDVATASGKQLCGHPDYCLHWVEPDSLYCKQHEV